MHALPAGVEAAFQKTLGEASELFDVGIGEMIIERTLRCTTKLTSFLSS